MVRRPRLASDVDRRESWRRGGFSREPGGALRRHQGPERDGASSRQRRRPFCGMAQAKVAVALSLCPVIPGRFFISIRLATGLSQRRVSVPQMTVSSPLVGLMSSVLPLMNLNSRDLNRHFVKWEVIAGRSSSFYIHAPFFRGRLTLIN